MTYVEARNFTRTTGRQIDLIVIHSMEAPEKPTTAENVAKWFAGPSAPRASAHWCFDVDSAVRCVHDQHVAWHAPGANHNGLGYELAGYARQDRSEWLDNYGRRMLDRVARQARSDCKAYDVPVRFVDAAGLKAGHRGITTHHEVSQAFRRSTHWDPGPGFPMDWFVSLVAAQPVPDLPDAPAIVAPVADMRLDLSRGSKGEAVKDWQRLLAGAGHNLTVDGIFGPKTEAATKEFQAKLGVEADGIVGPKTQAAVAKLLAWVAASTRRQDRPTQTPPYPGSTREGSRGSPVRVAQARLRHRGWRIAVDGIFGPQTDRVVRAFQAEKDLTVDGIIGPNTWVALWHAPVT